MKELYINEDWNFEEIVNNLKALKIQYEGILVSFSYFKIKDKNEFMRQTKDKIYKLKMKEFEKNKVWEYINGFEYFYVIEGILNRKKAK